MIAWDPTTKEDTSPAKRVNPPAHGLLYNLAVAFPTWAGAILLLYAVFVSKAGFLRIRAR